MGQFNPQYNPSALLAFHWSYANHGITFIVGNHIGEHIRADTNKTGLNDGQWHHVVGIYEKTGDTTGKVTIYADGKWEGSGEGTLDDFASPYPLFIGARNEDNSPGDNWKGTIDEVAIYNRVLTAEEIQQHYQSVIPELTTIVLMGLGILGLGIRQRRKGK
jgi:hypothetical protein